MRPCKHMKTLEIKNERYWCTYANKYCPKRFEVCKHYFPTLSTLVEIPEGLINGKANEQRDKYHICVYLPKIDGKVVDFTISIKRNYEFDKKHSKIIEYIQKAISDKYYNGCSAENCIEAVKKFARNRLKKIYSGEESYDMETKESS